MTCRTFPSQNEDLQRDVQSALMCTASLFQVDELLFDCSHYAGEAFGKVMDFETPNFGRSLFFPHATVLICFDWLQKRSLQELLLIRSCNDKRPTAAPEYSEHNLGQCKAPRLSFNLQFAKTNKS